MSDKIVVSKELAQRIDKIGKGYLYSLKDYTEGGSGAVVVGYEYISETLGYISQEDLVKAIFFGYEIDSSVFFTKDNIPQVFKYYTNNSRDIFYFNAMVDYVNNDVHISWKRPDGAKKYTKQKLVDVIYMLNKGIFKFLDGERE